MSDYKTAIAMWHYPHRTTIENIKYFSKKGLNCLSLYMNHIVDIAFNDKKSDELAKAIIDAGVTVTLHCGLPKNHTAESVKEFNYNLCAIAKWQRKYKLISIISFDVYNDIRDNIVPYVESVFESINDIPVALEDFGLTDSELKQIDYLKKNSRLSCLLDIGHLFIRLKGKNKNETACFVHSDLEGETVSNPTKEDFINAFNSKTLQIVEIHLHNNDGKKDLHDFLENGDLDITMIKSAINELGFNGIVTIESAPGYMFDCYGKDADEGILNTVNYWKNI